ncbi:hypothetical protein EG329_000005 [Mollisiaceae sp. DMI_Dod_QoI]|nr:hypothetical protein EG329_000005 [Helotiales sp. DMI_Dod_QoI]
MEKESTTIPNADTSAKSDQVDGGWERRRLATMSMIRAQVKKIQTDNSQPTKPSPPPKPKFLPYLTKKTAVTQHEVSRQPESPLNFSQIASSKKAQPDKNAVSSDTAPILHLPLEIWHLITPRFPQRTLAALIRTHSVLHHLLTPLLYHTINLNLVASMEISGPHRSHIAQSQYLFIRQMLAHPHLASHIKIFNWTMGFERLSLLPDTIHDEEVTWNDEDVFTMLEMLKNVVRVDIGTGQRSFGDLPDGMEGKTFFPKARYVKLSGTMKRSFVGAILLGPQMEDHRNKKGKGIQTEETTQLDTLILDDLLEDSPTLGSPVTYHRPGRMSRVGTETPPDIMRIGRRQPMQHILTPALYERCRNLHQLSIRVYGMAERGTLDDELWAEWATFIGEVKPKQVIFDCDRMWRDHGRGGGSALRFARLREQRSRIVVANDRRFGETLLPILKAGWDCLERIEVRGVGESVVKELELLEDKWIQVVFDKDHEAFYARRRE